MARRRPQISKVDSNHGEIVNQLRAWGFDVTSLAKVANGAPDICVGYAGRNYLWELKMPGKKLNPNEVKWHESWQGQVGTASDALTIAEFIENDLTRMRIAHVPYVVLQELRKLPHGRWFYSP